MKRTTQHVKCNVMKDDLWGIVNKTELDPGGDEAEDHRKFMSRSNHALAIIVLSVEPSLLYLIGNPEDPIAVWKKTREPVPKENVSESGFLQNSK